MLDNLRGMAVFASVVDHGSFSNAAKDLGITTSAVSQQIRALENELGIVLLHRSTRKLSLTEAGTGLFDSAKQVVRSAEQGRIKVTQLRDDLSGVLRVATTPGLGLQILPAISNWLAEHDDLDVTIFAENDSVDMIEKRIDIELTVTPNIDGSGISSHYIANVKQLLLASPDYLAANKEITEPKDLKEHQLICVRPMKGCNQLSLTNKATGRKKRVKMSSRFATNNVMLAREWAISGNGVIKLLDLDAQKYIDSGELVVVLDDYTLPESELYALTLAREQQPAKVTRCLEILTNHFQQEQRIVV